MRTSPLNTQASGTIWNCSFWDPYSLNYCLNGNEALSPVTWMGLWSCAVLFDSGTRFGRLPEWSLFLGDGEKVDGMGGHERALQWQGWFRCLICVNPVCWFSLGTITLCQANHRCLSCPVSHLCGSQPQMSRKENMYRNKAKVFHGTQSHLPVIFGSGILGNRNFLLRSLWIFLFYLLTAWTQVNFWHLITCRFTKYNFLLFTVNLEPASFFSWPASLGNTCCSWWKS